MLKRLCVHNFKCLQNFEFNCDLKSMLLLGRNGSGKSTIMEVLEIFQKIGQGVTPVGELINENSFSFSNKKLPIEFELVVVIGGINFNYRLEIEFPDNFINPKVKKEKLHADGKTIMERDGGQTSLNEAAHFLLDWHHVGLPLVSVRSGNEPLAIFRNWLGSIIILTPYPNSFNHISKGESSTILKSGENIVDWARWLLSSNPSLYSTMYDFLKFRMPDLELFKFDNIGKDERRLLFVFKDNTNSYTADFCQLSDGEKIFFLAATLIAAQQNNQSMICFWDEPDNFIGLVELRHFIMSFRKAFENSPSQSQLIITSHNELAINQFSSYNTIVVARASHLSPTRIRVLNDITYESKTVIDAYLNGEMDI